MIGRLNTHQQVRDGEMDEEEGHPRLDASVAPQQNAAELNSRPDLSQLKRGENHQGFALVSSMKARLRDSPLQSFRFYKLSTVFQDRIILYFALVFSRVGYLSVW